MTWRDGLIIAVLAVAIVWLTAGIAWLMISSTLALLNFLRMVGL